jgi:Histidine kinase-, DNA gyrase B-, and HSP90-like ATPase
LEGPYRDLGGGFARLAGAEGLRRSPTRLRCVEDALFELLRNSRDAGARNICVASTLRARRYRQLVVIDDGRGIPETHKHLVFEPGVTTRHLDPVPDGGSHGSPDSTPHGGGLSLYHIKNAALSAEVLSASSPTTIRIVFDTHNLPEKSLQSRTRPSKTNLPATLARFAARTAPNGPRLYHASPARILVRLLENHIIQRSGDGAIGEARRLREAAVHLGLEVSLRTVHRVVAGEIPPAEEVGSDMTSEPPIGRPAAGRTHSRVAGHFGSGGPILSVGAEDLDEIRGILRRAACSSYLDLAELDVETRPGEVILKAHIYEPEDEYE